MVSIKDVAETAGVSTATVSRVLADKPHVRPEVRERVMTAVKTLGYRPNRVARSLRVQKSNVIGLIVSDIQNPFFTAVGRAVEDIAYENQLSIFLCNSDEDPDKEMMYLNLMHDQNVAGLIISPTQHTVETLAKTGTPEIPTVVIDRRVRDVDLDNVLIDNVESTYKLVSHLIADGHRRIAAVFGAASTTGPERKEGFMQALRDHNLDPAPELMKFAQPKEEAGYQTVHHFLSMLQPPDAVFASNALLALGAFRALRESQYKVPDDVAFASFDETIWTTLVKPGVTVIEQPTYEIGQTATELLLRRIEEPSRPAHEVNLKGKLIVRQSCGCLA